MLKQTLLKDKHLKLVLEHQNRTWDAIWFNRNQQLPDEATLAFQLSVNEFRGKASVQLLIQALAD